jgi:hypothetical protein
MRCVREREEKSVRVVFGFVARTIKREDIIRAGEK